MKYVPSQTSNHDQFCENRSKKLQKIFEKIATLLLNKIKLVSLTTYVDGKIKGIAVRKNKGFKACNPTR